MGASGRWRGHWVLPWTPLLLAAAVVGAALRIFEISSQVVADDEMHSLRAVLLYPASYLFGHFSPHHEAASAPVTSIGEVLLLKLIAESVGLSETTYRLPALISGMASLLLFPALVRHRVGPSATAIFAALLAVSPLLVFYSRFERSYAPATLLLFVALMALDRWFEQRRLRHAVAYVVCGTGAVYFHLLASPAVFAPLLVGAFLAIRSPAPGRQLAGVAVLAGAILLELAALLANPLLSSGEPLFAKVGTGAVAWPTLADALLVLAGTDHRWLAALFWGGVAAGLGVGWRRLPRLTATLALCGALQLGSVVAVAPWMVEFPWILARYLTWTLPFALLLLAIAVAELGRLRVADRDWPLPLLAGGALVLALVALGPLPRAYAMPNNFANHSDFQFWTRGLWSSPPERISPFYEQVASEPGDFELLEAPWYPHWGALDFHHYQKVHGRPVRIGFVGSMVRRETGSEVPLDDPRLHFRRWLDVSDLDALRGAGIRYAVLHKDLHAEMGSEYASAAIDMQPVIALYEERFGEPVFEDETIVAFRVDRP